MKNGIVTIATAAVLALSIGAGAQIHKKTPTAVKKSVLICPITGDKIASAKTAVGHAVFKGKTYYFCCGMCKPRFDKNPGKFVANAAKGKFEKM
jgi:YHS domain-containing protein